MSFLFRNELMKNHLKTEIMTETNVKIKRSVSFLVAIAMIFGVVFTGCKKEEEDFIPKVKLATVTPANNTTLDETDSLNLAWTGFTASRFNVYFGEQTKPELYKGDVTTETLNVPVQGGHTYYWQIGIIDGAGREELSQVYTFKVKVVLDLDKFTGVYDCDEPNYAHYDVNISKSGKDTLHVDNFWDLRWKLSYVLDEMGMVKIVPSTFTPDPSLKVSVTGSGSFDNATNELKVNYVVLQDASEGSPLAIEIDRNIHTYKKK